MAVAPAVAFAMALGVSHIARLQPERRQATGAVVMLVWLATTLTVGWQFVGLAWSTTGSRAGVVPLASTLGSLSDPDDRVIVVGAGWDPSLLYFAERRGLMLDQRVPRGAERRQPDPDGYRFAVVIPGDDRARDAFSLHPWVSPMAPYLYEYSDALPLDQAVSFSYGGVRPAGDLSARPNLTCSELQTLVDAAQARLWLIPAGRGNDYVQFGQTLPPVPGDAEVLVVDPNLLTGATVDCTGDLEFTLVP
jgi:hypothetical protein